MAYAPTITWKAPQQRKRVTRSLLTTFMVVFLIYFLLPLVWLFFAATKTNSALFSSFGLWFGPDFNLISNLQDLFARDNGAFLNWLGNTVVYAVSGAVGSSLIATAAGYAFAKYRFAGRTVCFVLVLASLLVPGTALAIPLYLLLSQSGLGNSLLAIILPALVNPFGVYLMRIYIEQAVPDELIEAARIDGAGELRIVWSVAFRLLAPGFVTVLLFAFVATWNNYFLPLLVLSDPKLYPLTVGLANWNALAGATGEGHLLFTLIITGALVSIVPLIVAFLFLQRYWENGLTLGSVRG